VIYSAWDDKLPATFSPFILKNILREKLGFDGLIITDDLEMKAIEKNFSFESIPRLGSQASVDLYLICHDRKKTLSLQGQMIQDIEKGRIEKKQVEYSAQKIIDFKKKIVLSHYGKENLSDLARQHIGLIREMQSYLP
jgi:beta-N-acetylhexosaminidase